MVTFFLVGSLQFIISTGASEPWFSGELERRPVENREKITWKRVNKKIKRLLKRREIERQKKAGTFKVSERSR